MSVTKEDIKISVITGIAIALASLFVRAYKSKIEKRA